MEHPSSELVKRKSNFKIATFCLSSKAMQTALWYSLPHVMPLKPILGRLEASN